MGRFNYKVRDNTGSLQAGVITAGTLEEASQLLRADGKFIVNIETAKAHSDDQKSVQGGSRKRIKRAEVITFAHQMAVMIDTGVPISEALESIAEQTLNANFKMILDDVVERVNAGTDFSTALSTHPKVFPPVMISLMKASEVSGTMGTMLERVSTYMSKELMTAKKVRGALIYPAFMLFMLIGVTIFLITFVLPRFAGIYSARDTSLPAPTQFLMTLSDVFIYHWYYIVGGVVATIIGWILFRGTTTGKRSIDAAKLNIPIIGPIFRKLYITRACRTMGTMISAGVPILDMVAIVRDVTDNKLFEELWDDVNEQLHHGSQLSDALFTSPLVPRSVAQMIFSGEKSGRIGPVMEKIADFTEQEFDEQVKVSTQFIEPAMIGAMGLVIGFVAIALLMPIFTMGKVMASG